MKTAFLLFLLFIGFQVAGQNIGLTLGGGFGRFYDRNDSGGHFFSEYHKQNTYRAGLEIKDIRLDTSFNFKFYIGFEQYGGDFFTRDGGNGGSSTTQGSITKNVLDLQVYPFNFRFLTHATISVGLGLNINIANRLSGENSSWSAMTNPPGINSSKSNLKDIDGFVKPLNYYGTASLGYEFVFGKFILEPRYNVLLGLSKEFEKLEANAKSIRQSFTLSLFYKLKAEK
jgi:hypothetical protein